MVLPEPTGPPMPTRSGPWGCVRHERNSLVYWVSWRMEQRSTVSVAVPSSSSGQAGARAGDRGTTGSRAAVARWPSVWPKGTRRTAAETRLAAKAWR